MSPIDAMVELLETRISEGNSLPIHSEMLADMLQLRRELSQEQKQIKLPRSKQQDLARVLGE